MNREESIKELNHQNYSEQEAIEFAIQYMENDTYF